MWATNKLRLKGSKYPFENHNDVLHKSEYDCRHHQRKLGIGSVIFDAFDMGLKIGYSMILLNPLVNPHFLY